MINYSVSLIKVKKKEHLQRLCDRFTNSKCLRVKVEGCKFHCDSADSQSVIFPNICWTQFGISLCLTSAVWLRR